MDETFTLLPINLDTSSKALSTPTSDPALTSALSQLNALHNSLKNLPPESHQSPPPPMPVNPKRSAAIQKMREQANALLRKSTSSTSGTEAAKLYTYAIEMASSRPPWEPAGLVREELSLLYSNRGQAYMQAQMWPEALADAESSTMLKRAGNAKAWWRRGRSLLEMGRLEEAEAIVREGVEVEGGEGELKALLKEIEAVMKKRDERR